MKLIPFESDNEKELKWLMDEIKLIQEADGIEVLICVYKKKDGSVGLGVTESNQAEAIGLLELGKSEIIETLKEEAEFY